MAKKEASSGFNTPFQGLKRLAQKPAPPRPDKANATPTSAPQGKTPPLKPAPPARPAPAAKPTPAPPAVAATLSPDDDRFFAQAMRGVKPLTEAERGRRASPLGAPPPSAPRAQPAGRRAPPRNDDADAEAELAELVGGGGRGARGGGASERGPEVNRRLVRHLRDGNYPIEARLDLHGHSRDEAIEALERFIVQSIALARRCVLVIHGRGLNSGDAGPVLGEAVQRVLTASRVAPAILAFTHAGPAQGGDGATLVLLRKKKETAREP